MSRSRVRRPQPAHRARPRRARRRRRQHRRAGGGPGPLGQTSRRIPGVAEVLEESVERRAGRELPARRLRHPRGRRPGRPRRRRDRRASEVDRPTQRHDHDPAARAATAAPPCSACPATCGCRSPARGKSGRINSAYNDGPQVLVADHQRGARHPDPPLRRDRLHRVQGPRRRHRRRRDLRRLRRPGHQLRPAPRTRLPDPRRLAGARLRPQPPLRGVPTTATGRGPDRRPRAHRAPAAVHPHGRDGKLLQQVQSDPFSSGEPAQRGDRVGAHRRETRPRRRPPAPCATAAEGGLQTVLAAGRRRRDRRQAVLELGDGAQPILDYFRGVGPARPMPPDDR